jgi:dolichol-phosphate mannosyltransferase
VESKSVVVIPTYQEKENITPILQAVMDLERGYQVLVVDDNSPDGTAEIAKEFAKDFPGKIFVEVRQKKGGLGTAYLYGFKWALERDYEYIFEMDADFSHNPNDLPKLLEPLEKGEADLSIGSRYITGVNVVNWPMSRVLLSWFASKYVRMILGIPVQDTTAGFKCYKRIVLETINFDRIRFVGYAFQIEMKFRAWRRGFRIKEIPVIFTDRTVGTSKMSSGIIKEAVFGVILLKWKSLWEK